MANELPAGWTQVNSNSIATSNDPELGGIIDKAIVSGKWFVIFNSDRIDALEGFETRDAAFAAHNEAINHAYWLI